MSVMNVWKYVVIVFGLTISGYITQAQTLTQTVRGTVLDKDAQFPLMGVNVMVVGSNPVVGTMTDPYGNFVLEGILVGRIDLQFSYLGYEEIILPNIAINSARETVLNIEMIESVVGIEEVVITASGKDNTKVSNELSIVSTRAFTVEETSRYTSTIDDPSRMAQSFAGVSSGTDNIANEIVIRGNSPKGLLWQIEGIEIPNPNHFAEAGASSGVMSILSSNMLANSDFSTGAFTAEYGNALSGVFDIRLRKGNNEKREYTMLASMLGVDFSTEGPFKKGKKSSYLINYRYSTLAILRAVGINITGDAEPTAQNFSFKAHFPTKKAGSFSFWGIGGLSSVNSEEEGFLSTGENTISGIDKKHSDMGVGGLTHKYIINEKMYIKNILSFSATRISRKRDELDTHDHMYTWKDESFIDYTAKASITINNKFSAKHFLRSGIIYTYNFYDMVSKQYDWQTNSLATYVDDEGGASIYQLFSSYRYRISEEWTLNMGVHAMYFMYNKKYSIEPRLAAKWQFTPRQSFSVGFGMHSRRESIAFYAARIPGIDGTFNQLNTDLGFTKAYHYIVSYDNKFHEDWYLKLEAYYQDLHNIPIATDSNSYESTVNMADGYVTEELINEGTGENYGFEITLEKFFSKRYFMLFTGSVYNSKYTAIDGVKRNTKYNGNYLFNAMAGKEFAFGGNKQHTFTPSIRLSWIGGNRIVPLDVDASQAENSTILDSENAYKNRQPDYFRLDAQLAMKLNGRRATTEITGGIINALGTKTVVEEWYDIQAGSLIQETEGGIAPYIGLKFFF